MTIQHCPDLSAWTRYVSAITSIAVVAAVRFALEPWLGGQVLFVPFVAAVFFSVLCNGMGPAVLSLCLGGVGGALLLQKHSPWQLSMNTNLVALGVYFFFSGAVLVVGEFHRKSRRDAQLYALQLESQRELLCQNEREIRRMNEQLTLAHDVAVQASIAKSRFMAAVSHELRTPLNAIIGYSEMLEEEINEQQSKDVLTGDVQRIQDAGKHLLMLINDLLDLSKIEAGRMSVDLDWFDVKELLEEVELTARPLAEKNSNALVVECDSELGSMYADPLRVRQVLLNLLANASRFTEQGQITLHAYRQNVEGTEQFVFRVIDTGVGIAPEDMRNLFTKFYQANTVVCKKERGTGLELALSRQLCELMGGCICADSILGQGSSFTVHLPVVVKQPDHNHAVSNN